MQILIIILFMFLVSQLSRESQQEVIDQLTPLALGEDPPHERITRSVLRRAVRRQRRLVRSVRQAYSPLQAAMHALPTAPDRDNSPLGEVIRSYELLCTQARSAIRKLSKSASEHPNSKLGKLMNRRQPPDDDQEFEDYLRELKRVVRKQHQQDLLSLVEMLDTAERLTSLQVGAFQGIPKDLVASLEQVRKAGEGFRDAISQTLERRKVQRISLEAGERPPVESTEVVSREDNTSTDDYVIAKIVSPGYRMDDTVIRRAAVTVVTRQTTTGEEQHGVKPGN